MQYICFVSTEAVGGIWSVVKELLPELKHSYLVKLVLFTRSKKRLESGGGLKIISDLQIPCLIIEIPVANGWLFDLGKIFYAHRIKKFIGNQKAILHSHDSFSSGFSFLFLNSQLFVKFCTFHGLLLPDHTIIDKVRTWFTRSIRLLLIKISKVRLISCDPLNIPVIEKYFNGNCHVDVALNGVREWNFTKETHSGINVAYISRLHPLKGWRKLAEAGIHLVDEGFDVHLFFAGSGEGAKEVELFCENHRYATYLGHIEDVRRDLLPRVDIHVLPTSYPEGLPMILLETMSAGIPSVTTDVGSNRLAVLSGINGLIINPDVFSLSSALRKLLVNDDLRVKMGAESKRLWSNKFSSKQMASSYIRIFDNYI